MSCLLCFEYNNDFIGLTSGEARELKVGSVLLKHFGFVFQEEPQDGKVCRKCWCMVQIFNQFYTRIEEIHTTVFPSVVVIEDLMQDLKNEDTLKNETNTFDDFNEFIGDEDFGNDASSDIGEPSPTKVEPPGNQEVKTESLTLKKLPTKSKSDWDSDSDAKEEDEDETFFQNAPKVTFQCNFCMTKFDRRTAYQRHLKVNHADDVYECTICSRILLTERAFTRHNQKLHISSKGRRSLEKKAEKQKEKTFKTLQCRICSEYFLTEKHLEKHHKLIHLALPFRCRHIKCVESFNTMELLEAHQKEVHAKSPCQFCGKQVMTIFMEQHYHRMHNKDKQAICDQCGKVFPNNYMLKTHVQTEHDAPERLECDICKGTFRNKYNLQKHMKIIHIDKPQACHICGKISPNSKALRSHLYVHKQPDKECIVCGKRFKHSSKLREHSYTHSGVTDAYSCDFCGKTFRFGSSWSAHKMKYHPEEMAVAKERLRRIKHNALNKAGANLEVQLNQT